MQGPEQTTTTGSVQYGMPAPRGFDPSQGYLYALPVILVIMALRMWRGAKVRPLRIERLWISPALYAVLIGLVIYQAPPPPSVLVYVVIISAFLIGLGAGWMRGRMVRVSIDVETHALTSQMSPWGLLIFAGLIGLRMGLRGFLASHEDDWHISPAALTDGFMLFYGGMVIGRIVEIWIRATRLLRNARAAKAGGQSIPNEISEDHA
jgi:hypothetical protein